MKFHLVRTYDGWFWRLVARNGETLCHSEMYTRKASAEKAIKRVKWDSHEAPIVVMGDI